MKKFLIVCLFLISCFCFFSACSDNSSVEITFEKKIQYAEATLKEECDLSSFVKKQKGYDYYLEAVQVDVDKNFEVVNLETHDLTFTPTLFDDAFVTLCAKKGGKVYKSSEIKINVIKPKDKVVEKLYTSWKDTNFTITVNTDQRYIYKEKSTSAKYSWFGAESIDKDRYQYFATLMGDEITEAYSVTDWNNAVLSFWVYNPSVYSLDFCPIWSHTGANLVLAEDPRTVQTAKPNGWTEIKYSLRYYGMVENFFFDLATYTSYATEQVAYGKGMAENGKPAINQNWWTVRWGGRQEIKKAYSYDFYVSNFDIRNYDQSLDDGLDTTLNGFDKDFVYGGDSLIKLPSAVQSKDGLEFEAKVLNDGVSSFCVIDDSWQNYIGYFKFDVKDPSKNSEGVTVKLKDGTTDIYVVNVNLKYGGLNGKVTKETLLGNLYFGGSKAQTLVGKITVKGGQDTNEEIILAGITKTIDLPKQNVTSLSFEYKVNTDGHISLCLYNVETEKYYGYFDLNKSDAQKQEYAGVTYTVLTDGYVKCDVNVGLLEKYCDAGKPDAFHQIYVRGDFTDANGVIRNVVCN